MCGWHPGTGIEFIPDSFLRGFSDDDIELMADMSAAANRHPQLEHAAREQAAPDLYQRQLARVRRRGAARGGRVVPMFMPQNGPIQHDFLRATCSARCRAGAGSSSLPADERIRALADPDGTGTRSSSRLDAEASRVSRSASVRTGSSYFVNEPARPGATSPSTDAGRRHRAERGMTPSTRCSTSRSRAKLDVGFVRHAFVDDDEWIVADAPSSVLTRPARRARRRPTRARTWT